VNFYNLNAFTGPLAAFGTTEQHGLELAQKELNASNGGAGFADNCGNTYQINFTQWDMAGSREQAIAGVRQAASDQTVLAVLGPFSSVGFVPSVPVAGEMKIPLISPVSIVPIPEWNPYVFRTPPTEEYSLPRMLTYLSKNLGMTRVAVVYDITNDVGVNANKKIGELASQIGYQLVATESYRAGDVDFRTQITRLRAGNPDWLASYVTSNDMGKFFEQADQFGLLGTAKVFSSIGTLSDPQAWDLTNGRVAGAVNWVDADPTGSDPRLQKYGADHLAAYGVPPNNLGVDTYQAIEAYVDAVKRSCTATDREKFRDALAETNTDVMGGHVTFKSPRNAPTGENVGARPALLRVKAKGQTEKLADL
jgi:branched-chain amino acid transport system substrate-binding protein